MAYVSGHQYPKSLDLNTRISHIHLSISHNIHAITMVWFDFCFRALEHILGHFGRGQLP